MMFLSAGTRGSVASSSDLLPADDTGILINNVEETLKIKYVNRPYVGPNAHNRIKCKSRSLIKSESLDTCSHQI